MKNRKRHKTILILMITSQLLLTGFVIQWLGSQYREERRILAGNLRTLYLDSQNELLDSMLLKTYVDPVLSNPAVFVMKDNSMTNDTTVKNAVFTAKKDMIKGIRWKDSALITVSLRNIEDSSDSNPDHSLVHNPPDELLLKSVKLIAAHMEDSSFSGNRVVRRFSFKLDTSEFKSTYSEKLNRSGMAFAITWDCKTDSALTVKDLKGLVVNPSAGTEMPAALVSRYNSYLITRIMPQILFGIVLVLITALAFYAAYRSIRYQVVVNEFRNEFISNITHELKTPVATLRVALESLGKFNMKTSPHILEEYLNLASAETQRLEELINRVLDHSQLEEYRNSIELRELDMPGLIKEVISLMERRSGINGKIDFSVTGVINKVFGDRLYLQGVLINLLDNSIKYCDKEPYIMIDLKYDEHFASIIVSDNGPGIPDEYQKKIFDKFFRVPTGNVHNVKGYGLGLSFASLVMKLHKGSIDVRNLNPGCAFYLKLPLG